LQCVLAARILTVDFVVCTPTVEKKNQGRFRYFGPDHSLVSYNTSISGREGKGIPVTGRGNRLSCETSRLPHFL
jgi:hypothetical protein